MNLCCSLTKCPSPSWILNKKLLWEFLIRTANTLEERRPFSPNNEKGVTIHVKALHSSIIVLQYDFYKPLVCSINYRSVPVESSIKWCTRKIKFVRSLHFVKVSKPDWCTRIDKWYPIQSCTQLPVDGSWWQAP